MNVKPDNMQTRLPAKNDSPRMFDRIAHRYDLLNRLLSMRRDVAWRRRLADLLPDREDLTVLDVATGTADVLLTAVQRRQNITHAIGIDPAGGMVRLGRKKTRVAGLNGLIQFVIGDARSLPFADHCFDAATIAFGIRNVPDPAAGLREMHRVLRTGGKALVLEFSLPHNRLLRTIYLFYFRHVLPRLGAVISGDSGAYRYLNRTVEDFPSGSVFCELMERAGFTDVNDKSLSFGIASIYTGTKK